MKTDECPQKDKHTPSPEGYLQWHSWAREMSKAHRQTVCPGCGRLEIWVPKVKRVKDGQ